LTVPSTTLTAFMRARVQPVRARPVPALLARHWLPLPLSLPLPLPLPVSLLLPFFFGQQRGVGCESAAKPRASPAYPPSLTALNSGQTGATYVHARLALVRVDKQQPLNCSAQLFVRCKMPSALHAALARASLNSCSIVFGVDLVLFSTA
jgi:hypothetical protein